MKKEILKLIRMLFSFMAQIQEVVNTGTQHIYANNKTGKISMYGEKGYLAVFTASSTLARGDVSFYK